MLPSWILFLSTNPVLYFQNLFSVILKLGSDDSSLESVFEPPHDKNNKLTVRPAKTQIILGIRPVLSESSLCAQWVAKDSSFLRADIAHAILLVLS